jgi:hypothetical protein
MPTATVDQRPKEAGHNKSCELGPGVDTHKDVHVAAVLTVWGALPATRSFPAARAGYRDLLAWAWPDAPREQPAEHMCQEAVRGRDRNEPNMSLPVRFAQ